MFRFLAKERQNLFCDELWNLPLMFLFVGFFLWLILQIATAFPDSEELLKLKKQKQEQRKQQKIEKKMQKWKEEGYVSKAISVNDGNQLLCVKMDEFY